MSDASERVRDAFARYLAVLEEGNAIEPGLFADLTEPEREEVRGLIEVFDLAGAVGCPTAPPPGFIEKARDRIERAASAASGLETGLFGARNSLPLTATGETFGAWLKRERRTRRLTYDQVARAVGCSGEYLAELENDQAAPTSLAVEELRRLGDAVGVGFSVLLQWMERVSLRQVPRSAGGMARSVHAKRDFASEYAQLIEQSRKERQDEQP